MEESNKHPLISVITVCFNSENTIEKTIKSMLEQTYDNYEYYIIDGKSTDRTVEIIENNLYKFGGRLKYISEKDTGIYNAMNKGIKLCSGDIIGILNSDDYYSPRTLEWVANKYCEEKYPFLIVNGDMERVDENDQLIYRYRFSIKQIQQKNCFGHPSMFAARAVYDKIGLYDESYRLAADGEWQYRAHDDSDVRYVLVPEVFNHMREGGASDNPRYRWKWFKERVRMKKEHNRGSLGKIYFTEFRSVLRTDMKYFIPKKLVSLAYRWKYRNNN